MKPLCLFDVENSNVRVKKFFQVGETMGDIQVGMNCYSCLPCNAQSGFTCALWPAKLVGNTSKLKTIYC